MADPTLYRIHKLVNAFRAAVTKKFDQDGALQAQIAERLKPGEAVEIANSDRKLRSAQLQFGFDGQPSNTYMKMALDFSDQEIERTLRVLSVKELDGCLPSELKSAADIAFLREAGAGNIADVCAGREKPKPETPKPVIPEITPAKPLILQAVERLKTKEREKTETKAEKSKKKTGPKKKK